MRAARRHLSTVTVAAATAVVTATVITGGPALAASVVAYATNAGAVDGRHAVPANASLAGRRGKLVATGAKSGRLPDDIIARAPDSARLQGTPLSGLAGSAIVAYGSWSPTGTQTPFCATAAYVPPLDSFATVVVDAEEYTDGPTSFLAVQAAVSTDGGTTFAGALPAGILDTTLTTHSSATVSAVATVALTRGRRYAFAGLGYTSAPAMSTYGKCTLDVQVTPRLPGTRVIIPTAPTTSTIDTGRSTPDTATRR